MAILIFIVLINAFVGFLVFARNTKSAVNRIFLAMSLSICLWSISSYFTDNASPDLRLFFAKAAFFFPVVVSGLLALFSRVFPLKLGFTKKGLLYVTFVTAVGIIFSVTNLVVYGVKVRTDGTDVVPGLMYNGYTVIVLLLFTYALVVYIKNRHKVDQIEKMQAQFVAFGFMSSFIWALVFNVILPIFVTSWVTAKLGPAGTVFFVGATAYAIIRHKLFDIRLIVARSLGYALSIIFLGAVYALIAFNIANIFAFKTHLSFNEQVFYVVLAVVLAFSFPPAKKFFDKFTNRLFYRDAYEPQVLIDQLNKVLVGTIELEELLKKSSTVIGQTLKSEFCVFGIKEMGSTPRRIVGDASKNFPEEDINYTREVTPKMHTKIIVADELGEENRRLGEILRRNNISVIARLTDTPKKASEGLGYIILGPKKSGNPYSSQDTKMLEIISDELVIAIQNSLRFEEIQNFAETLQEKVNEATRQLRRTNEKLKQMDQTKDDFISMASHQLRTPLTSVKGYVSMVMEGDAGKITAAQKKLLDQAFISSQRMVYLIADLLNVSRLRTGKFIIEPKPTNLAEVVEGEISQLTETAKGRDLELTYHKPKDFPTLMLDDTKIRQVIMNFADNAIYYTPAGGHIQVNLEDKGDSIEFTVVDDGIGVPKEEQHHLFGKFYRAGNAKKARPDGTGLGLFMAKKVIVAQGGALIFHSEEGKGSTFGFSFAKSALSPDHFKAPAKPAEEQTTPK